MAETRLPDATLSGLKRWNTPAVYNGWEQVTGADAARECFNLEPTRDFLPQLGPMVGYAVTVTCEASNPEHPRRNPDGWNQYRRYVASVPGPKIVVVQDLDKPVMVGAWWGEVNASTHQALGCVGSICDGAIRDVDEVVEIGFKVLARGTCVGHAHSWPVEWGGEVEVFGVTVRPGQLIHADQHGFLVVPKQDQARLLEATEFMDATERRTVIAAARNTAGKTSEEMLGRMDRALDTFRSAVTEEFSRKGEW